MSSMHRQRGESRLGCLVGLVVLALAAMVAYRLIPVKVKTAELRDVVIDEARSAGAHSDAQIEKAILAKAKQLELPVTENDVFIKRSNNYIRVEVKYAVPVEFPGFTYNWKFNHNYENPIF